MIDIILFFLHALSIVWLLRIIAAGVGHMEQNVPLILSWFNVGMTVIASFLLVGLDRYYAQSGIATWRLYPVFMSGIGLLTASVFWIPKDRSVNIILKILPRVIGVFNILICGQLALHILTR